MKGYAICFQYNRYVSTNLQNDLLSKPLSTLELDIINTVALKKY